MNKYMGHIFPALEELLNDFDNLYRELINLKKIKNKLRKENKQLELKCSKADSIANSVKQENKRLLSLLSEAGYTKERKL